MLAHHGPVGRITRLRNGPPVAVIPKPHGTLYVAGQGLGYPNSIVAERTIEVRGHDGVGIDRGSKPATNGSVQIRFTDQERSCQKLSRHWDL